MDKLVILPTEEADMKELGVIIEAAFASSAQPDVPVSGAEDLKRAWTAEHTSIVKLVLNDALVGGAVLKFGEGGRNRLELYFIAPEAEGRGLGLRAWRLIEARYPETKVWETETPYFERRNIHFYVNKCGFHIAEYFNEWHPDRRNLYEHPPQEGGGLFRFEKIMSQQ